MTQIAPIEDLADPSFDPILADEVMYGSVMDPYDLVRQLREEAPVQRGDFSEVMGQFPTTDYPDAEHWMVLSYAGIEQVLNQPEKFSNRSFEPTLGASFGHTLSVMDPPEHTGYRKILQQAFRPNVVQSWGDGIVAPVIEELVGCFRETGRADLAGQFARPYPFNVIYRMLDLPPDDIDIFYKLTVTQILMQAFPAEALEASQKLGRYFRALIEQRRAAPGDDLVTLLALTEIDHDHLPDDVVVSFLRQLVNAGGDTTYRTTTVLLHALLTNPDQLEAVRHDRELVNQAIEEALRFDGPVLTSSREAVADVEVEGVTIPAGSYVNVLYGAANHDPAVFEHPDRFDVFRAKHRHFGFAFGVHNCLGQQLARLEMSRALNAVFDELPGVRLDPDQPVPALRGFMMRTPATLPVVFAAGGPR
jgi:cytochrome P450